MNKDSKKYLMKRRRYGWGWTPTTWQGWVFTVFQIAIIIVAATSLPVKPAQPTTGELTRFFLIFGFSIINLIIISSQIAPSPKWRWGKKDSDNSSEDF